MSSKRIITFLISILFTLIFSTTCFADSSIDTSKWQKYCHYNSTNTNQVTIELYYLKKAIKYNRDFQTISVPILVINKQNNTMTLYKSAYYNVNNNTIIYSARRTYNMLNKQLISDESNYQSEPINIKENTENSFLAKRLNAYKDNVDNSLWNKIADSVDAIPWVDLFDLAMQVLDTVQRAKR